MPKYLVELPDTLPDYFPKTVFATVLTPRDYAEVKTKPVTPEILEAVEICLEDCRSSAATKTVREFFDASN